MTIDLPDYTNDALDGFLALIYALQNNPAEGTGIYKLIQFSHNTAGPSIPIALSQYMTTLQFNLFGDYPSSRDIIPSAIFCAAFAVIGILHTIIFTINTSRGHYFWMSAIMILYSIMRVIGWAARIPWSMDVTKIGIGIVHTVFTIVASIVLISVNLILAQRLFTWRHPVGGSRDLFWNFMIGAYIVICLLLGLTIVANVWPYLYFLSQEKYDIWVNVVRATSILIVLYSVTGIALINLSYFFKPTSKDENLHTYQPWWIESFSPTYFVEPHAARAANATFMKRNHNHRYAIRVIAATHHHYKMVEGLTNQRGSLTHNTSLIIIVISSAFICAGAILRSVVLFQGKQQRYQSQICQPVVMYIMWGLLEVIINILFIVGRIDLRFYRPDILPQIVRSIITAEQSHYNSDDELSEDYGSLPTKSISLRTPNQDSVTAKSIGKIAPDDDDDEDEFRF
ncbi:hypothetical protein CAAN1_02S03400 [[Candida] anglica]|uniref:Uncharacterized protein n=1 Tax=[Candida] anglica TaxID=148631 RepID=A0ABP0E691_9ASCO